MPLPNPIQDFIDELRPRVQGDVRDDSYNRMLYSTDASIYQVMPHAVMFPKNCEDIQAAVETVNKFKVPVLARGGGTSLAGQAVNEALILDTSRHLDRILEVNAEEKWVRVEPGVVLDALNMHLRQFNLQFGPDPASSNRATIGGIVSNNSTGSHSILYGMTSDHVIEIKGYLSDGSPFTFGPQAPEVLQSKLAKTGLESDIYRKINELAETEAEVIRKGTPRHWRRCGGYNLDRFVDGPSFHWPLDPRFNLAGLISGAEGTLAVITEIKLNLVPLPKKKALGIIHFRDLYEALSAVPAILEVEPSVVELLDRMGIVNCRKVPAYARLLDTFMIGDPNCLLITEFYGESEAELHSKVDQLGSHLKKQGIRGEVVPAIDPKIQANVWGVRKVGLGLLMSVKGDHKPLPFIEDAAVPVEHLADYVTQIEDFCRSIGTDVGYYAHASAGCLHVRPLINAKDAGDVQKIKEIMAFSVELLGQYGGSLSSEHGDGRVRSWMNEQFFGKELYRLYKEVKEVFDPENLFNPGNIVDPPPFDQKLRYGAGYEIITLKEHLDFSEDMGFHRAVEMCNGAGICRKQTEGTMCPSFMVTQEEEHSTRGRANALRAAMSGVLPADEFASKRMFEVMDLCVECKACKAECPSSVDMAKIKFEYLGHYYDQNPVPLRSKLFGNIARINRMNSGFFAPIANWGAQTRVFRWGLEKFFGVSSHRQIPSFARTPFNNWFEKRETKSKVKNSKKVVLFNDTFNNFNQPEVARAALEVLEAAGFEVVLPGHFCCGRPMISKGLVEEARQMARDTVATLVSHAKEGVPIIGLEPSCLLTMRDEYLSLLPDSEDAKLVANATVMFEEFIADLADKGELDLNFETAPRDILLHGHCHQKALVGIAPSSRILSLPPGYSVTEVDSGCCGMAGSFGYEAEHYDISIKMGERRLLPAVREQHEETLVVAAGVSCRDQIQHGAGRRAYHPAEILRMALIPRD